GMAQLDFYRQQGIGLAVYRGMLPTLAPHLALGVLLVVLTALALDSPGVGRRTLPFVWAALCLGCGVALFHTGAFAYFWITLGLFPAVGLALALPAILGRWGARPLARLVIAAAFGVLFVQGLVFGGGLLRDSQRVQRESLRFLQRNFPKGQEGFHLDRAPFCRHETDPLPDYISERIVREFSGPARAANVERFLARFRARGVYFLLDSYRLAAFPREIQRFWIDHFVPYFQSVWVPGFLLDPSAGIFGRVEVLVAGSYRLEAAPPPRGPIRLDGNELGLGQAIMLEPGWHQIDLSGLTAPARLVWDLKEPAADPRRPFYTEAMTSEIKFGRSRR
ncbi:MAG: hypothetical protein ACREQY_05905, partial [Candidatus Binatia bacterium]